MFEENAEDRDDGVATTGGNGWLSPKKTSIVRNLREPNFPSLIQKNRFACLEANGFERRADDENSNINFQLHQRD